MMRLWAVPSKPQVVINTGYTNTSHRVHRDAVGRRHAGTLRPINLYLKFNVKSLHFWAAIGWHYIDGGVEMAALGVLLLCLSTDVSDVHNTDMSV